MRGSVNERCKWQKSYKQSFVLAKTIGEMGCFHRMKRVILILLAAGVVAELAILIFALPREPVYAGKSLSYWMAHWYYGGTPGALGNPSAKVAIREAGTNALPFLIKWMGMRFSSDENYNYPSWALHGFEVLGPTAKAAVPDLVALLGKRGNFPDLALAQIGPDAIPALTDVLRTNRDFRVRRGALEALSYMGTNAEPALPCLLLCLKPGPDGREGETAGTLAEVGRNRPETVIPALIGALTNSTGYGAAAIADALSVFGGAAKAAVPGLLAAGKDREAYVRTRAAAALQRISPETKDALEPLVQNLQARDTLAREQALWALEELGTNGAAALPVLVNRCLRDHVAEVRIIAMRCVGRIGQVNDGVIAGLSENATNGNHFVTQQAVETLAHFASRSKAAFVALLRVIASSPVLEARGEAATNLEFISRKDPTFLIQCLEQVDPVMRYCAMKILYRMEEAIPEAVPPLVKALQDDDRQVRAAATNCLIRLDDRAARQAGIRLPPR